MEIKRWLTALIQRKDLEEACEPEPIKDTDCFFLVESINKNSSTNETFLVYDCSQPTSIFDYDLFRTTLSSRDDAPEPVVVFKNWDQERKKYWVSYDNFKSGLEKRNFSDWFNRLISIYIEGADTVCLKVEDNGINYLEYNNMRAESEDMLNGRIYNISFFELKKLFNVTGAHLFNNNVRYGLKKHITGEKIKVNFRKYILRALCDLMNSKLDAEYDKEKVEKIQEIFAIEEFDDINEDFLFAENFWFYHNGISIFCYSSKQVETPADNLILSPESVSVINGAQTLTNFYSQVESIERNQLIEALSIFAVETAKSKQLGRELMSTVLKKVIVKTVVISGESKYIRPITYGLNTQIPILEETLLADSKNVTAINRLLKDKCVTNIRILKEGEQWAGENGFQVLDFVKNWLAIQNRPGESKNLGKKKLESLLKEILNDLKSGETKSPEKLEMLILAYQWWDASKKHRLSTCDNDKRQASIGKYGKNYFGTYVVNSIYSTEKIDDSVLIFLYEQFEKDLLSTEYELDFSDFKKDALTEKMLEQQTLRQKNTNSGSITLTAEMKSDLVRLLNKEDQSAYTFSKTISHYLISNSIIVDYFRVISRFSEKCKEAFPFPNSTFMELASVKSGSNDYPTFEESSFLRELEKEYPAFIIDKDDKSVIDVNIINTFSFIKYKADAQKAYSKTVDAFKLGNESSFPRSSSGISFHIRPKAINSKDTFEFTNGDFITKRTFWANKDTVENIIKSLLAP